MYFVLIIKFEVNVLASMLQFSYMTVAIHYMGWLKLQEWRLQEWTKTD